MSAIISGKIRLALQNVDLAEVLKSAIETVQPAADAKNVGIMASFDPDIGRVSGDPNRLQQVFWNLLSNAVKFTSRGGSINVQLERVASHLEVRVQDSGEGIKPEFLAFVFDRFRQEDATTTRRVGGLGLGLAIVKQLVELHGGSVHAASDGPSLGSTFTIKFPMRPIRQTHESISDSEARAKVSLPTMSTQAIAGLRILVVDDELDARVLVRRLLNERGAETLLTGSAAEALEVLSSTSVDVLISDIGMPVEDGYSLIRRVRQLPGESSRIPAVALTAYARAEDREKILQSGFQEHLAKPVDAGELLSVIARLGGKPSVG